MKERLLKNIADADLSGKTVLIRGDLDVEDRENPRVQSVRSVVRLVINRGAIKVKVIGHRETDYFICDDLRRDFSGVEFDDQLRADPGEKANDTEFARKLGEGWDVYVNESFAVSHRKHASLDALPRLMRATGGEVYAGPRMIREMEMLDQALTRPGTRLLVAAGIKENKIEEINKLEPKFDVILVGGKLPLMGGLTGPKMRLAKLREDGLDIDDETIRLFKVEIDQAETIVAAGVMGRYEEEGASQGTKEILEAIAGSSAYKIAGGGDIETAIGTYNLSEKFDWISVGGGAMLEYLATGTLPGIEALAG